MSWKLRAIPSSISLARRRACGCCRGGAARRSGNVVGRAVDRGRRGIDDLLAPRLDRRLEDVERAADKHVDAFPRPLGTQRDPDGGLVEHVIAAGDGLARPSRGRGRPPARRRSADRDHVHGTGSPGGPGPGCPARGSRRPPRRSGGRRCASRSGRRRRSPGPRPLPDVWLIGSVLAIGSEDLVEARRSPGPAARRSSRGRGAG